MVPLDEYILSLRVAVGALIDETLPGRPADLSGDQREAFEEALHEPPTEVVLDALS